MTDKLRIIAISALEEVSKLMAKPTKNARTSQHRYARVLETLDLPEVHILASEDEAVAETVRLAKAKAQLEMFENQNEVLRVLSEILVPNVENQTGQ